MVDLNEFVVDNRFSPKEWADWKMGELGDDLRNAFEYYIGDRDSFLTNLKQKGFSNVFVLAIPYEEKILFMKIKTAAYYCIGIKEFEYNNEGYDQIPIDQLEKHFKEKFLEDMNNGNNEDIPPVCSKKGDGTMVVNAIVAIKLPSYYYDWFAESVVEN